jgi:phytoene desaturase
MARQAIIIGSGIGGLATAIRLAAKGYQVTVYEKNAYAGGKLSAFEKNGYFFDAGPSLFTQPQYIEELFAIAKQPMEGIFSYVKAPNSCHYFFNDGSALIAPANASNFASLLKTKFNEDEAKVLNYLKNSESAFNNIGTLFTNFSLHKLKTFIHVRLLKALAATKLAYLFKSLHSYNTSYFKHKNTQQIFNRFATYNGSNPYQAPAMLSMIPHFEINVGTFYPIGGMISITNALLFLCKKLGVEIVYNSQVNKILVNNNNVTGIEVNNQIHSANIIVSNMDVYFTYKNLLSNAAAAAKILKQERSSSAYIFYWGINKSFEQLGLHNIIFSQNYKQEFELIFKSQSIGNDVTVYINISAKMEPNQAPNNCENWFVMVNTAAHHNQNWANLHAQIKQAVINKINTALATNIEPHIVYESVLTPKDIEAKTASYTGSLYGSSSNSKMAAFMRQRNNSTLYKGLYFVGGSVHPGGGIPLCLSGAKIVANLISSPN